MDNRWNKVTVAQWIVAMEVRAASDSSMHRDWALVAMTAEQHEDLLNEICEASAAPKKVVLKELINSNRRVRGGVR